MVKDKAAQPGVLVRWLTQTPLRWSQYAWIWPLVGALLLALVGFWVRGRVEGATRAELASRLVTLLNADIAALRLWFSEKEADALSFASDARVQAAVNELVSGSGAAGGPEMGGSRSPAAQTIDAVLKPLLQSQHYLDYVVVGTNRHVIASAYRRQLGRLAPGGFEQFMTRALAGKLAVSRPFARELGGPQNAFGPTMFVVAPVRSTNGAVVAVLGLRMQPEEEFTRIFSVARMGETGEAYAFDRRGVMLTRSRFEPELKKLGLIPDLPEATAILNLRLVDPGHELNARNAPPPTEWRSPEARERSGLRGPRYARPPDDGVPLTRMAAAAIKGLDDWDVQGYRNYRGIKVVGAWAWLPEYGMGVATEVATSEAFQMLYVLRQVFMVLFGLLVLSAVGILAFGILVNRLRSSLRNSALTARKLG
jgi:eukaryotic-like serine/threonine-protein kinase